MDGQRWVVCDIDGVLADPEHRLKYIKGKRKDWDGFFDAAKDDTPRAGEVEVLSALADRYYMVCLLTGRSDRIRGDTVEWLARHGVPWHVLYMRGEGDHRPDTEVKPEFLADFMAAHGVERSDILCIFEDRAGVVDTWREMGFLCFQNAPGDF